MQNQTCKLRFTGPPSLVELRSSGGAGEYQGDKPGLYQLLPGGGEGGMQGPVYRQLHNTNDQHFYLYRWDIDCDAILWQIIVELTKKVYGRTISVFDAH